MSLDGISLDGGGGEDISNLQISIESKWTEQKSNYLQSVFFTQKEHLPLPEISDLWSTHTPETQMIPTKFHTRV